MARHQLPRGRHVRYALPEPVTRHAVVDDAHTVAGSIPVRRGIAVVAVVGGALSVAGSAVTTPHPEPGDASDAGPATEIGLAANSTQVDEKSASGDTVLDTTAVASTVRKAAAEGQRLAADQGSQGSQGSQDSGGSAGSADTGGPTASMPGELINPDDWYLTLPTGKKGSPDTIDGSKLATYHSKFFGLNQQRNGIVFNAGADGVTTKNSHYPRSELREMDGSKKASWSNTSGTHVFDVREAFTKLPKAKPEVVGVQIHDNNDDVLQIRLEGKNLMVQYHNGKSSAMLDSNYQLGTPFDVRIVAANGGVDVLYNGKKTARLPLKGSGWYWKVGAYVQSNGSKGDGAGSTGEVVVYKADVAHAGGSASSSSSSSKDSKSSSSSSTSSQNS